MEEHRFEHHDKLKQIRANARARPLDKVRAGLFCLGLALVLFASMGLLAGLSAIIGVVACVIIYGIVSRAEKSAASTTRSDRANDE